MILMSAQYRLDTNEVQRVGRNALLFLAPAIILALGALQAGKTWEDIQYILYLWLINTATDLLRKFMADNTK